MVTPVLNEEPNMDNLVGSWRNLTRELTEFNFSFILVDDGSTDGTAETARKLAEGIDLKVLSHPKNMGPGYAFGTGFEYLADLVKPKDIVVTIEGDNTSRISTLKIMLGRITRENADVAFASPHAYGGGFVKTSWIKVMLSHAGSACTKLFLGIRGIHTFSSFFRAHQGYVIIELQKAYGKRIIEFSGFECMIEMLKKLIIFKFTISEVPMNLDTSLRKGKSKMKIVKTMRKYFSIFAVESKWERVNVPKRTN